MSDVVRVVATAGTGPTGAGYGGSSTTSLAIGTGSKSFTLTTSGFAYVVGSRVRAASAAAPTATWMEGVVTSYSGNTLVVNVDLVGGSGTHADWSFTLAGERGATGATGTAATIAVGTVSTGAAGSSASVTNVGTSGAAVFDITIPRGDTGVTGTPFDPADANSVLALRFFS